MWLQVTNFWNNVLNEAEKTRLVNNIAGHLKDAKEFLQKRAVSIDSMPDIHCTCVRVVHLRQVCSILWRNLAKSFMVS